MKVFFTTCVLFFIACTFTRAQTVLLETFNGTTVPSGWTTTATTGNWSFSTGAGYDVSAILDHTNNGGNYAWIDFSGTDVGVILQSPIIDVSTLTTPYLQFYYESHYTGTLTPFNFMYLEAWNGTAWVLVNTFQGNTPFGWDEYGFNMSAYTFNGGNDLQFRFRGESGGASNDFNNDLLLDDVEVMELPTCPKPSNLAVNNITATSADFAWVENGTATNWQVEFGPQGFTPGNGNSIFTTNNPHTQTLAPASVYSMYVRSVCSPGDTSRWAGPINFMTLCAVITAPWIDDVESHTPTTTLTSSICWDATSSSAYDWNIDGAGSTPTFGTGPSAAYSGTNFFYIETGFSGTSAELVSPYISINPLSDPVLQFQYHMFGANMGDLYIDVSDGSTWTLVDSIMGQQQTSDIDPWLAKVVSLSAFSDTIQVRFRAVRAGTNTGDISLDDIEIKDAPNVSVDTLLGVLPLYCNVPINVGLVVSNKSANFESDIPWAIESDGMVIASGVIPNLAPNSSDTIPLALGGVGPAGPNAIITAYTYFATDQVPSDDTISTTVGISNTGVNATMTSPVGCAGAANGEIQSMGNNGIGMYTYLWDPSAASQTTSTATGLSAGTYMLTVTDSIGCSTVATLTLLDPPTMNLTSTSTNVNCNGDNDGSAVATTTGGIPGYTYLWSNGQMTNQLMNAVAGTYTVSVTDANGCELTNTVTLTEPTTAVVANVTDNGDGTATAGVTGGLAPYTYQWDPSTGNQTTVTATGLTTGNIYYVVVTDANGCSDVISFRAIALKVASIDNVSKLNMFPNPTSANVFVELNLVEQADVQIQITTVTGQVVMTHQFNQTQDSKFELETAQLPTGVYMVQFTIGANELTKKLIITK